MIFVTIALLVMQITWAKLINFPMKIIKQIPFNLKFTNFIFMNDKPFKKHFNLSKTELESYSSLTLIEIK